MDIGRSLTYFTEEERWIEKSAIGAGVILISTLLSFVLVGIVGFFIVLGYCVRLMQNVQNGVKPILPEWNQWGADLTRGFKLFVIQLIWALPAVLITLPIVIGSAIADGGGGGEFFGVMLILCGSCLVTLYSLFIVAIQPAFTIAYSYDERISTGLQLSKLWRWTRTNLSDVLIVTVVYLLASIGLGLAGSVVGVLLCGIGLLVTIPLSQLALYYVQYHLYGQLDPGILVPGAASYDASSSSYSSSSYSASSQDEAPFSPESWTPTAPMDIPPVKPDASAGSEGDDTAADTSTNEGTDEVNPSAPITSEIAAAEVSSSESDETEAADEAGAESDADGAEDDGTGDDEAQNDESEDDNPKPSQSL